MSLVPELILREVTQRAVDLLRVKPEVHKVLFATEVKLLPTLIDEFTRKMASLKKIPVVANFPTLDLTLPNIAVLTQSSNESDTFLGGLTGFDCLTAPITNIGSYNHTPKNGELDPDLGIVSVSDQAGWFDQATFKIVVTSRDETFTSMLTSALRFMLYHAKIRLETVYGVQAASFSEADFAFPQEYWPEITWSKSITMEAKIAKLVSLAPLRDTEDEALWEATLASIREIISQICPE